MSKYLFSCTITVSLISSTGVSPVNGMDVSLCRERAENAHQSSGVVCDTTARNILENRPSSNCIRD